MSLKASLTPESRAAVERLQDPAPVLAAVARALDTENKIAVDYIVRKYLSFPKAEPATQLGLRAQSGRLRSGMASVPAVIRGGRLVSAIGNSVKYAAAHEFGATIPARQIVPTNAKALRFQIGDRVIFAKRVNWPGAKLPARAPVQRGLADCWGDYQRAVAAAVTKAMEGTRP